MNLSLSRRETTLFTLATAFVLLGALALRLAPYARAEDWAAAVTSTLPLGRVVLAWGGCAWVARWAVKRLLPTHDPYLLPVVYLLCGWGLLLIGRLTSEFGVRQAMWLPIATLALLLTTRLPGDLRWLRRYRYTWLLGGVALTAITVVFGVNPSGFGQRLWLGCCGFYLQPAEILKLLLVAFLAAYLSDKRELLQDRAHFISAFLPLLSMWGFSILVLFSQRDLGMSTLFFAVFLVMLYLASGRARYVALGLALLMLGGVLGYGVFDVVRVRVDAWWNPWADASGRSFQIVQALLALAAGGLTGRGPGLGAPTLVPVAHSDFIVAALAEEWGVVGLVAALGLLAVVVWRGWHIAARASGVFRPLLAAGLTTLMGLQTLMIIGGVVKLVPLTGVTVPFLSYGGSSLVTQFVMIGVLLKLSADSVDGPIAQQKNLESATLNRLTLVGLTGFALLAVTGGYWGLVRQDDLLARADNPRRLLLERRYPRGLIYDRYNHVLAEAVGAPGDYTRHYPYPALAPVLGYVSPIYGVAGIEASADATLHGDETDGRLFAALSTAWNAHTMRQLPTGRAVQLTLDLDLQTAADAALGAHTGAVVVVDVTTGEILALASHPTFDANDLDAQWAALMDAPTSPLLNRATFALYQPGGALQPALLAAFIEAGLVKLTELYPQANAAMSVGELQLRCLHSTDATLTFTEAFQATCPQPFAELGHQWGAASLMQAFTTWQLFDAPNLGLPTTAAELTRPLDSSLAAIGQDEMTLTPLHLAMLTAALANGGRLTTPSLIAATQNSAGEWVISAPTATPTTIFAPEAAAQVKALMSDGHSAIALTDAGGKTLAWYTAYAPVIETRCAIVVLLEDGDTVAAHALAHEVLTRESICGGIGQYQHE